MIWNIITNTAKAVGFTAIALGFATKYVAVEGSKRIYRESKEMGKFCKETFLDMKGVLVASNLVKNSKFYTDSIAIARDCDTIEEFEEACHKAGMLDYDPETDPKSVKNESKAFSQSDTYEEFCDKMDSDEPIVI